jgi:hypothetical protein
MLESAYGTNNRGEVRICGTSLDPGVEELVAAHLRTGRYRSPEEVVTRALETLAEREPVSVPTRTMTPAEAEEPLVRAANL